MCSDTLCATVAIFVREEFLTDVGIARSLTLPVKLFGEATD